MAVNVKMGVDLSGFTSGIKEGQGILKGLNAEMKATEAEFKATGNAEQQLAAKTKTLNSQINVQKSIAQQAQQALKTMSDAGVDPANAAYQRMYVTMMNATAGMNNAQAELNALGSSAQEAANGADQLSTGLQSIGKKISLEQVITGIDRITSGLEAAAKKAIEIGENVWNSIMDSARWADDTATQAQMYGIDIDSFQRMQKLVTNGLDTSVEAMLKSQQKFNKQIGEGNEEFMAQMKELGLVTEMYGGKVSDGIGELVTEDSLDLFFRAGQAIMSLGDEYEKEAAAQKLFGKSWRELVPLFEEYKTVDEYREALEGVKVVSEENVLAGADLNDKINELKGNFDTLKNDVLLSLAPALTQAADALNGLLTSLLDYLETPEGKQMLADLGTAVSGLFEDLSKIDPQGVIEGFKGVFDTIVSGLQWIKEHSGEVVGALEAIVLGWAGLKLTGGALQILNLVNGLKGLTGGGTGGTLPGAGSGDGGVIATGGSGGFWATLKTSAAEFAPFLLESAAVTAVAITPAVIAQVQQQNKWIDEQNQRLAAAEEASLFKEAIRSGAMAIGPKMNGDGTYQKGAFGFLDMNPTSAGSAWLAGLSSMQNQQRAQLFNAITQFSPYTNGQYTKDLLLEYWANPNGEVFNQEMINSMVANITDAMAQYETKKPELPVELKPTDNAVSNILAQIGEVTIPATIVVSGVSIPGGTGISGGGGGMVGALDKWFPVRGFANGIFSVPYDGMLARLHKGERVMTAREVKSQNYSSNLYVESMYMNNNTDANGLASAMAAAQRRAMAGYGS